MRLNKSAKNWLDMFMKLHSLENREEAVYKLIEIYKTWNENLKPQVPQKEESDNSRTIQSADPIYPNFKKHLRNNVIPKVIEHLEKNAD